MNWKTCSVALGSLFISSCQTGMPPAWDGKVWAGSSQIGSIERRQDQEVLSCGHPDFDKYVCMTGRDFKSFVKTYVDGCLAWDKKLPRMSVYEAGAKLKEVKALP